MIPDLELTAVVAVTVDCSTVVTTSAFPFDPVLVMAAVILIVLVVVSNEDAPLASPTGATVGVITEVTRFAVPLDVTAYVVVTGVAVVVGPNGVSTEVVPSVLSTADGPAGVGTEVVPAVPITLDEGCLTAEEVNGQYVVNSVTTPLVVAVTTVICAVVSPVTQVWLLQEVVCTTVVDGCSALKVVGVDVVRTVLYGVVTTTVGDDVPPGGCVDCLAAEETTTAETVISVKGQYVV